MTFDELIAVGGMQGLFKVIANKSNGLIVKDIDSGKTKFVSARKYQFTPLASIAIYTYEDSTPLKKVFTKMHETFESTPPPAISESADSLRTYFKVILEDHDESRVHHGDIKKVIKWFNYLSNNNLQELFLKKEEEEEEKDK